MKDYITIFINGDPFNCDYSMSIKDVLLYLNFDMASIIIEYNREIISQSRFHEISLKKNDQIEVITMVGGG